MRRQAYFGLLCAAGIVGATIFSCGKGDNKDSGKNYSFVANSRLAIKSSKLVATALNFLPRATEDSYFCGDSLCFTPSNLTGKYYGVGFLIQSNNHGMTAYLGNEVWSDLSADSPAYDFDFKSPVTQTGNLTCCSGEGDLSNNTSYIEDVVYLFGYFDVSFSIPESLGAHGEAVGAHTIRTVLADDAVVGAKRGDLLYKTDSGFQWMASDGTLSSTRPDSPVTMDKKVVDWTNPFGDGKGNQKIPVIYTQVNPDENGGPYGISEDKLKTENNVYTFDFDATGFVFYPTILKTDVGMLDSRLAVMKNFHIQGLPHSTWGDGSGGSSGKTTLTISTAETASTLNSL